jgi:hypothetical protein
MPTDDERRLMLWKLQRRKGDERAPLVLQSVNGLGPTFIATIKDAMSIAAGYPDYELCPTPAQADNVIRSIVTNLVQQKHPEPVANRAANMGFKPKQAKSH